MAAASLDFGLRSVARTLAILAAAALAATAAVVVGASGLRAPAPAGHRPAASALAGAHSPARATLSGLPLAAQGPVSAALGRNDRAYRMHDLAAANPAAGLRLRYRSGAMRLSARGGALSLGVAGYGRSGRLRDVAPGVARTDGNRVIAAAGPGISEWFANGPLGVEQGFDVSRRPAGSGPLTIAIALSPGVRPTLTSRTAALLTSAGGAGFRYQGLTAVDARGRTLRAWLAVHGRSLAIRVADRGAVYPLRIDPFVEQSKLVPTGEDGAAQAGYSVALSSDGNTALVGGPDDTGASNTEGLGAVWAFGRSGSTWTQEAKLTGANPITPVKGKSSEQGFSVALSADGSTALIGGPHDAGGPGAVWAYQHSGTNWTADGKLTPNDAIGGSSFGSSVALDETGTTALIGGPTDNSLAGAVWVYTRSGSTWTQATKLTASDEVGSQSEFGSSVAIDSAGTATIIGGPDDGTFKGAAWAFTGQNSDWTEWTKFIGTNETGQGQQGASVAISADGSTVLVGGPYDDNGAGSAWVFDRSGGNWAAGPQIVPTDESSGATSQFGMSVALSTDGASAVIGGPNDTAGAGAAWVYDRSGTNFTEAKKLTVTDETGGAANLGQSVAISYPGTTLLAGGPGNASSNGAAWTFVAPSTTTGLNSSLDPAVVGQQVTLGATVSPSPGSGTIAFLDGGMAIAGCGAVTVTGNAATCTTSFSQAGSHSIQARYSGNASYAGSTSPELPETVTPSPTTTTLTISPSAPSYGVPATLTATVTPTPDAGAVQFKDNGTVISSCELVAVKNGQAQCTYSFPDGGDHTLTALYTGDLSNYDPSSATLGTRLAPTYTNSSIGISVAQAAGDPAQTGPSGASLTYNGVPLVAGRATLVRVFADPSGLATPGAADLSATLSASANGKPLPGSPLKPDTGGPQKLTDENFATQLGAENTSFNFVLPASWTSGTITLSASVSEPASIPSSDLSCIQPCHASLTVGTVPFTVMPKFEVTPVELTWKDKTSHALQAPGNPQQAMALAYELMPVQTIVNEGYQGTIDESSLQNDKGGAGGNAADGDGLNLVLQWAANKFLNATGSDTGHLHDMVVGFNVSLARGDTYTDPELGTMTLSGKKYDVYEPTAVVDAPNNVPVAHEMGHAVGRLHADQTCGGPAGGGSDPDWPDRDGHLEPSESLLNGPAASGQTSAAGQSYGADLAWRAPASGGQGPFVIFPSSAYDIMSYCGNEWETNPSASDPGIEWTSARGWGQELACLKEQTPVPSGCPTDEQQSSAGRKPAAADIASASTAAHTAGATGPAVHGDSILFLGYVEPGGTLISPAEMPTTGGATGPSGSPFSATLTGKGGKTIATEPLSYAPTHFDYEPGHPALAVTALSGWLPTHGQTVTGLVVHSSGHVVETLKAPGTAPRVTVKTPKVKGRASSLTLRWNSHDHSAARRTVYISFSAGRRFTQIWEGYDKGRATIPLSFFGHAGRIRLRVTVSDGFAQSTATTKRFSLKGKGKVKKATAARPAAWELALERDGIRLVSP